MVSQAGIAWSDYGEYLSALQGRGYEMSGALTESQADVLHQYQQQTLASVAPAGYTPPGTEEGERTPGLSPGLYTPIAYVAGQEATPIPAITNGGGPVYTPTGLPVLAAVAGLAVSRPILMAIRAIAGRFLTVANFRMLMTKFGPAVVKTAVGASLFGGLMNLISMGAPDDAGLPVPKRRRRYSIGANPRVRTLQKVAGHTKRLLQKHDKLIRAFLPRPTRKYGQVPARMLSAIEKEAMRK